MNVITTTWRQLVRRRLWPVALLLVAALAAVPVLLTKDPDVPAPPAVAVAAEADHAIAEPVVAEVTPEDRARRRRVLGARKDPFRPAPVKKAKVDEPKIEAPPKHKQDGGTGTGSGAQLVTGGGGGVTVPVPTAPVAPKKYYEPGTIVVRFGAASETAQLQRFAVSKFEALPDNELPLLVYMGLTKNGKKAKFLVDAAVEVDGDGTCKPHRSSCETIELAVGETEFLDVIDPEPEEATEEDGEEAAPAVVAQFQLDLVDIKRAGDDDVK